MGMNLKTYFQLSDRLKNKFINLNKNEIKINWVKKKKTEIEIYFSFAIFIVMFEKPSNFSSSSKILKSGEKKKFF